MSEETVVEPVVINVTFRNLDHFHRVIKWMNTNIGTGSKNWCIKKPVKKFLGRNNAPVSRKVHIAKEGFTETEIEILLNLM
jgi:hypothetical protein